MSYCQIKLKVPAYSQRIASHSILSDIRLAFSEAGGCAYKSPQSLNVKFTIATTDEKYWGQTHHARGALTGPLETVLKSISLTPCLIGEIKVLKVWGEEDMVELNWVNNQNDVWHPRDLTPRKKPKAAGRVRATKKELPKLSEDAVELTSEEVQRMWSKQPFKTELPPKGNLGIDLSDASITDTNTDCEVDWGKGLTDE